jgi:hypothetical protein
MGSLDKWYKCGPASRSQHRLRLEMIEIDGANAIEADVPLPPISGTAFGGG